MSWVGLDDNDFFQAAFGKPDYSRTGTRKTGILKDQTAIHQVTILSLKQWCFLSNKALKCHACLKNVWEQLADIEINLLLSKGYAI